MARMRKLQPLPTSGALTLLRALFKRASAVDSASPLVTQYELSHCDAGSIERYRRLLGFATDAVPVTFYYVLAQRAQLATMLQPAFPFRVVGMVHVDNAIVERRPLAPGLPLQIATSVTIEPSASVGARYCELLSVGTQQGETVFECRSRYLAVRRPRATGPRVAAASPAEDQQRWSPIGEWALTASSGRAYAAVSGDWNPIHLWRWSARLLGMKAPIIHGMHSVGQACALLERLSGRRATAISAQFKAPLPLGSAVELHTDSAEGEYRVACKGQTILTGTIQY